VTGPVVLFLARRFGGVTGDVLGATGKLAESAALLAGAAIVV
jgi:cobalamin synthase